MDPKTSNFVQLISFTFLRFGFQKFFVSSGNETCPAAHHTEASFALYPMERQRSFCHRRVGRFQFLFARDHRHRLGPVGAVKVFFCRGLDPPPVERKKLGLEPEPQVVAQSDQLPEEGLSGGRPRRVGLVDVGADLEDRLLDVFVREFAAPDKRAGLVVDLEGVDDVGGPGRSPGRTDRPRGYRWRIRRRPPPFSRISRCR